MSEEVSLWTLSSSAWPTMLTAAFLNSYGRAAPVAGEATWCQMQSLRRIEYDGCLSLWSHVSALDCLVGMAVSVAMSNSEQLPL